MNRREFLSAAAATAGAALIGCSDSQAQTLPPGPASPPNLDPDELRAIIDREAKAAGTRAVVFGAFQDEREILTYATGNSMTTVPATADMHWRVGGISEPFITTLSMLLHDQKRINLDDKISRWLPNVLSADQVTIRMLVANTAGYFDYARSEAFIDLVTAEPFRTLSLEDLLPFSTDQGMAFPPGTSQAYSHTEYLLLSSVLPAATGQSMRELFQENILGPVGLKDTELPLNQEIMAPVLHAFTLDRGPYEDCTYYNPSWAGAYGGLTSTVRDIGRWSPVFGTGKLLTPASFQELTGPSSVGKGGNAPELHFCYGFVFANGWYVQNPSFNGFSGGWGYNPANGVTLVVGATKSPKPILDPPAFPIFKKVLEYVTPNQPIPF